MMDRRSLVWLLADVQTLDAASLQPLAAWIRSITHSHSLTRISRQSFPGVQHYATSRRADHVSASHGGDCRDRVARRTRGGGKPAIPAACK